MSNGNDFVRRLLVEPKPQTIWGRSHTTWFTFMGIGSALYLNRVLFGIEGWTWLGVSLLEVAGWLLIAVGGLILMADLGRPRRFLRALANLRSSWISWGALADFVFLAVAPLALLPGIRGTPAGLVLTVVGACAAVFIIVYPALVLLASPSIPFWNSAVIPLQFLAAGFASAAALGALSPAPREAQAAAGIAAVALAAWLLFNAALLLGAVARRGAAARGAREMWRGRWAPHFQFSQWLGVALPLGVALVAVSGAPVGLLVWLGLCALVWAGNWAGKRALLGAGYYEALL